MSDQVLVDQAVVAKMLLQFDVGTAVDGTNMLAHVEQQAIWLLVVHRSMETFSRSHHLCIAFSQKFSSITTGSTLVILHKSVSS
jgi:hypothetical protein